jgi:protein TonB
MRFPAPTPKVDVERPADARGVHFDLLDDAGARSYRFTFLVSVVTHVALIAAIVIIPLMLVDELVPPSTAVRAFFVEPPTIAPPPPPPPPPAPGLRAANKPVVPTPPPKDDAFRAPVTVPAELPVEPADMGIDLGVEGGVPGGVEGGIAGGVVGGVVGGIADLPPPPVAPVRVGGNIKAPALLHKVAPVYPLLAKTTHVTGVVIVEARVDDHGQVQMATILRGLPLLDESALEAVRQWRYQPLLLNGQPTPFVVVVTVNFNLT